MILCSESSNGMASIRIINSNETDKQLALNKSQFNIKYLCKFLYRHYYFLFSIIIMDVSTDNKAKAPY